ncbi:MAG: hypothetical protein ACM3XM_05830 [Mycobacterium leprae]
MAIWQLTDEDVEAVVSQLQAGKSKSEVAENLGISVEMVTCAVRKWPSIHKRRNMARLIWGI